MPEVPAPHVAHLGPAALARVEQIEKQLGHVYVVAYEKPVAPADLRPEQVNLLQQAEHDLGVCLVAYRAGETQ